MIDIARGRYWSLPWSLISGCTPCSPGCEHCWSASMTRRFDGKHDTGYFLTNEETGKFNGQILTHPERLSIPLKRKKPTVYAVWNDLFHDGISYHFLNDAYATMEGADCHIYLILTKRPHNMAKFLQYHTLPGWQKDHIWNGLTICNQQEADEKIPIFLQVPGKKFLSIEPMLGAIDLMELPRPSEFHQSPYGWPKWLGRNLHAVILGGETGPGARPMHPDWVISIVRQCRAAGVPVFVKQIHINGKISKGYFRPPPRRQNSRCPSLVRGRPMTALDQRRQVET